ncbi:MAG: hypothetical protein ABIK68_02790 [bacterium]
MITLGFILVLLLVFGQVQAAGNLKVQGSVQTDQGIPAVNVTVVLMKIVMARQPVITPMKQTQTNAEGHYEFLIEPLEDNVFFRINAMSENSMTSSEPFRFADGQSLKTVQLIFPKTVSGMANLQFSKHILVFEALEEALQVTEIINISNKTGNVVDVESEPLIKQIPAGAENFRFYQRQDRFQARRERENILFKLLVPPGDHQLYFSYDLSVKKRSDVFINHLPPRTAEMEIITPLNSLELAFDRPPNLSSSRVVKQEKQFGNKIYDSQTLFLDGDQSEIKVIIRQIPISQNRFFYPAIVLAGLLFLGLFFFLIRKPQPVLENGQQ